MEVIVTGEILVLALEPPNILLVFDLAPNFVGENRYNAILGSYELLATVDLPHDFMLAQIEEVDCRIPRAVGY